MTAATSGRSLPRNPFRSLMGVWCILVAALPVVATAFGLIPIYDSQRRMLPAYTGFFCLLGFAYVFSLRHGLARTMFRGRLTWTDATTPDRRAGQRASINYLLACLILASIGSAATYLWAFESGRELPLFPQLPRSSADAVVLALSYIAMFLLAEAALAIMTVREYVQDVLGLSDAEVITGASSIYGEQLGTSPSPDPALPAVAHRVIPPGTAHHRELSEFDREPIHVGSPGLLRRIRMTISMRH